MDTFDFILLLNDKGLINDNDFLLVLILHLPELRFASQLLLEPPVIPTTKQNNTDKKLDFSADRVFIQCDPKIVRKYKAFNSDKIHFEQLSLVDTN